MDDFQLSDGMRDEMRAAWHRYLDRVAPFRPLLHGYCRKLTRDLWDAEDLSQETLMRGFQRLAWHHDPIDNPRAYLLRIATHAWIDQLRRHETEARLSPGAVPEAVEAPAAAGEARDASRRLLERLAPREQAAVVLKDLFDLDLQETAMVLETTVGAVKSALHRGRERLRAEPDEGDDGAPAPPARPAASVEVVDRFVERLNAGDRDGLLELIHANAGISNVGVGMQYGDESLRGKRSFLRGVLSGHPEWPEIFRFEARRFARAAVDGEPVVLGFCTRERWGGEALEGVFRVRTEQGRITRILSYSFCPETVREIAERLDLPVRTGLYRYPTVAPGVPYGWDD
jgi:RNA polymerase sigma-70 factor (ECF subfamily)